MAVKQRDKVAVLEGGKVAVGAHVDAATAQAVEGYVRAWATVRDDLVRAAAEAAQHAKDTGQPRSPAAYRTARLNRALAELTTQMQRLGMLTGVQVTNVVAPVMAVPQEVLAELSVLGAPALNRAPAGELQAIIRRQQEAIASRYLVLSTEAEAGLRDALLRGIARGEGSEAVARGMVRQAQAATAARLGIGSAAELDGAAASIVAEVRGAFAGGMQRALVLARTELIDASRVATTASYLANPDVVHGWEWMATLDRRTCPACWGMHGQVFAPDVHQEGHQQCRCTQSPLLAGERPGENGLQDRDAAFRAMSRAEQLQVLGPKRLAAYEAGVSLDAMAQRRDANGAWRASYGVTPVAQLPKPGAAARPPAPAPRQPTLTPAQTTALDPTGATAYSAAERLRVGPILQATEQGRALQEAAERWQLDKAQVRAIRDVADRRLAGGAVDDLPASMAGLDRDTAVRYADALLDGVRDYAGARPDALYRGLSVPAKLDDLASAYAPGKPVDIGLSSWTSDTGVAEGFIQAGRRGEVEVLLTLAGPAPALPMQNLTTSRAKGLWEEKEWLTAGRYQVTSATRKRGRLEVELRHVVGP